MNNIIFDRIKENLLDILNIIDDEFNVYYKVYILRGIIYTPFSGHYTAPLVNLNDNYYLLNKASNYFYDDTKNNGELTIISEDYIKLLISNLSFILIYENIN